MKKLILILATIIFAQAPNYAFENGTVLNLHSEKTYVIDIEGRPNDIQVSNKRISTVNSTTELYSDESQLLITTSEEGISYVTYKIKNVTKTIKLLIDNKADEDPNLWVLDEVDKGKKE